MLEEHLLITPENVPIRYELAGVGSRFVAALLDGLILLAAWIGLSAFFGITAAVSNPSDSIAAWLTAGYSLLSFALIFGYPIIFEISWSGQTPGKRKTGIRMIRNDGGPITALAVVIRNVIRLVDFLPAYYIIGAVAMLIDRKGRRLGDLAAGTICVKERRDLKSDRVSPRASTYGTRKTWPNRLPAGGLALLTQEDIYLVKEYLMRRDTLEAGATESLAARIAEHIAPRIGAELGGHAPDDLLERIGFELEQEVEHSGGPT